VVASRVGGIQDQIVDGECGILVDDPHDLAGFGAAIGGLLAEPDRAARLGAAARRRVLGNFLGIHNLRGYAELLSALVRAPAAGAP
jgi:trehalose synthase